MKIHTLVSQGDVESVRQQLSSGVSVNLRDDNDLTPLAVASSSPDANSEMLSLLIDSGAEVSTSVEGGKGYPLSLAACTGDLEKAQLLTAATKVIVSVVVLKNLLYCIAASEVILKPRREDAKTERAVCRVGVEIWPETTNFDSQESAMDRIFGLSRIASTQSDSTNGI